MLYLVCESLVNLKFKLIVKRYDKFTHALWYVASLKNRTCMTKHFAAAPTPQSSAAESDSDDSYIVNQFEHVQIQKHNVISMACTY